MANSLFNQLNQQPQNNNYSNPMVRNMINVVRQSGMSARDLFYDRARQMGIDGDEFLKQNGMNPN